MHVNVLMHGKLRIAVIWNLYNACHYANVQEAYLDIAAALSEADGIDYTDPEEVCIPDCLLFYVLKAFD